VDGCYAHWVGGCWPLIEACFSRSRTSEGGKYESVSPVDLASQHNHKGRHLYSREGLTRYILCCCQDTSPRGGLRDKPSKNSDPYHTCYVLAGLSSAQHVWYFGERRSSSSPIVADLPSPYKWTSEKYPLPPQVHNGHSQVFDEVDRVETVHPVFVVPEGVAESMRTYFIEKGGF